MTQTDGKIYHVLGLEESILSKWSVLPKQSTDSVQITKDIIHRTRAEYFKICMKTQGTPNSQNNI